MKKILILVSLVALVASGLFAEVTFSGKVEYGVQHPADADGNYRFLADPAVELKADIKADDANSGVIKLVSNRKAAAFDTETASSFTKRAVVLDRAYFTTDYLAAFGLGMSDLVKITGTYGLNEYNVAKVGQVTDYDTVAGFDKNFTVYGTMQTVTILNMITIAGALGLDDATISNVFVDAYAKIPAGPGEVQVEAYWISKSSKYADGSISFQAAYPMTGLVEGLTIAPGVGYFLTMKEKTNDKIAGGAKVSYASDVANAYLSAGAIYELDQNDNSVDELVLLVPIALGADYASMVGVDVGVYLDLKNDKAANTKIGSTEKQGSFDHLDGSLWVKAGAAKFRVGYLFVPDKETALDALKAEGADFKAGGSTFNGRGIYFNASLAF